MPNISSMEAKFQPIICWTIWKWNNMKIMGGVVWVQGRDEGVICLQHSKHLDWIKFSLNWEDLSQSCVRDTSLECQSDSSLVSWKFSVSLPSSGSSSYFDLSSWDFWIFGMLFWWWCARPKIHSMKSQETKMWIHTSDWRRGLLGCGCSPKFLYILEAYGK